MADWKFRKIMALSIAAMFICMTITITTSDNAEAVFINPESVPWNPSFTPLDSAWDSTGDHCIVVGNDTSGYGSSVWYYNEPSSTWFQVMEGGDASVPAANHIENANTGTPYASIQAAINAASPGDTIEIWSGIYTENVVVDIPLTLQGNNSANTVINGNFAGDVVSVETDGVNIYDLALTRSATGCAGLHLFNANNCRVENNTIYANDYGILLEGSSGNLIKENNIESNVMGMDIIDSPTTKKLIGTTENGGEVGSGALFEMDMDGSGYDIIHDFKYGYEDGRSPQYNGFCEDVFDPNIMYSTTSYGGANDLGTLFKINKDGSGYQIIHNFTGGDNGYRPYGGVTQIGNYLYGMTYYGGTSSRGLVYSINRDGSDFSVILNFNTANGASPRGELLWDGAKLYGMTYSGGAYTSYGALFSINTDGSGYSLMHSFSTSATDGRYPYYGSLVEEGGVLYGMTQSGGTWGYGTVFRINNDGSSFSLLHSFNTSTDNGRSPYSSLVVNGGMLYGMTQSGGLNADGTIFSITTTGLNFQILHDFNDVTDGRTPYGHLTLDSGWLYGTTAFGGTSTNGIAFKITTAGGSFTVLHNFDYTVDGRYPYGNMLYDGGMLYGMTSSGGIDGSGMIFSLSFDGFVFTTLYDFTTVVIDMPNPTGHAIQDQSDPNVLYGMCSYGGYNDYGGIYKVNADGSNYEILYEFDGTQGSEPYGISLVQSGNTLYGATTYDDMWSYGTIFSIQTDGTGFTLLHQFMSGAADGDNPEAALLLDGTTLYGTTRDGGLNNVGTLYRIETDGTGFTVLHSFMGQSNWDGADPYSTMIIDGTTLYGTTRYGHEAGTYNYGTVYSIETDGSNYQILHSFSQTDGAYPSGELVQAGQQLYGTTYDGGANLDGAIYTINKDGTGFTTLYDFTGGSDGSTPYRGLVLDGTLLYGMTSYDGGATNDGTVFSLDKDTTMFTILHQFSGSPDAASPYDNELTIISTPASASSGNLIYHNNFISNTQQANDDTIPPVFNFWENGLPNGGNYWSDYGGIDLPEDGIGDSAYNIPGLASTGDPYPWMREDGWRLPYATFSSVKWDDVNGRFWLSGEYVEESQSSIFYIPDSSPTTMVRIMTPDMEFTAVCPDDLGNILIAGKNLDAMFYYVPADDNGYMVTEAGTGKMWGWNITDIAFNSVDNRFYVVGTQMNQDKAVAFHTDIVPLDSGSDNCYIDTSGFLTGLGELRAIDWNPLNNYGLVVGDGVYKLNMYDGNPSYELSWTERQAPQSGITYYDVSWDSDGWNEAGIAGVNNSFGSYWRYYHTRSTLLDGFQNATLGTSYTTCAMKPPSSPKWLYVIGPTGTVKVNIQEKDESLEITFGTDQPQVFDVGIWKQSDVLEAPLFNTQVDPDSTYSFMIEANYTVGGVDNWNNLVFDLSAWFDNGAIGAASVPFSWASNNFRTRQFNMTYFVASASAVMVYPSSIGGVQEFEVDSVWEDPTPYGLDGFTHRLIINITFGAQTMAAAGAGFSNGAATGGNIWDKNMAFNDPGSWDMQVLMYDSGDPSMYNYSFEEFGIKEFTSISSSGSPGGSGPPGSVLSLSPSTSINYTANTAYYVTVAIPDLHINGDVGDPRYLSATEISVRNIHSLASGNSDISVLTSFTAPDSDMFIWGQSLPFTTIPPPVSGEKSAGPYYSDYDAAAASLPFEYTILEWEINIPVAISPGVYRGTISLTISS